eukprot:PhF_6_TR37257/c0_g1_i2/m.54944
MGNLVCGEHAYDITKKDLRALLTPNPATLQTNTGAEIFVVFDVRTEDEARDRKIDHRAIVFPTDAIAESLQVTNPKVFYDKFKFHRPALDAKIVLYGTEDGVQIEKA